MWRELAPDGEPGPQQGWKIHLSATPLSAPTGLRAAHEVCVRDRVPFKHLRSAALVHRANSKYAARGVSGKVVTVYPRDERQLEELAARLAGEPGPYVLSDLRIGAGPVFVRYGGFAPLWTERDGERVLAVTAPDGTLVPDERAPRFAVPAGVPLPEFLLPHVRSRTGGPGLDGFRVTAALHFSNGGGVYRATRLVDGADVVLKEARPHAGLSADGADAVTHLGREEAALRHLAGIPEVPAVYERVSAWEHEFLAMEHRAGVPLSSWVARLHPLTSADPSPERLRAFTRRATEVWRRVRDAVDAVHGRFTVLGDLHPTNILVFDDDRVSLIVFEIAHAPDDPPGPPLRGPGLPGARRPRGLRCGRLRPGRPRPVVVPARHRDARTHPHAGRRLRGARRRCAAQELLAPTAAGCSARSMTCRVRSISV